MSDGEENNIPGWLQEKPESNDDEIPEWLQNVVPKDLSERLDQELSNLQKSENWESFVAKVKALAESNFGDETMDKGRGLQFMLNKLVNKSVNASLEERERKQAEFQLQAINLAMKSAARR